MVDLTAVWGTTSMSLLICVHTHTHAHTRVLVFPRCLGRFWHECLSAVFWLRSSMQRGWRSDVITVDTAETPPDLLQNLLQNLSRTYDTSLGGTFLLRLPHRSPLLLLFLSLPLFSFLLLLTAPVCCMHLKGLSAQLDFALRCQNKYWCSDSRDVNQFLLQFTFP